MKKVISTKQDTVSEAKRLLKSHLSDLKFFKSYGLHSSEYTGNSKAVAKHFYELGNFDTYLLEVRDSQESEHVDAHKAAVFCTGGPHSELRFFPVKGKSPRIHFVYKTWGDCHTIDMTDSILCQWLGQVI